MFFTITQDHLQRVTTPVGSGSGRRDRLVAEASTLGFGVGEWPDRVIVMDSGDIYIYVRKDYTDGDTRIYTSPHRPSLAVLND